MGYENHLVQSVASHRGRSGQRVPGRSSGIAWCDCNLSMLIDRRSGRYFQALSISLFVMLCVVAPVVAATAPVHQCDQLAADPVDYQRAAPPVDDFRFLPKQAVVECRKAVTAYPEEPRFRFQLGRALLALGKADEARELLRGSADKGYAVANLYLGRLFEAGSYAERDPQKALEHYLSAATQGHQDAQVKVGLMYRNGGDIETDHRRAFDWFKDAADQGNPHAHFFLGSMYVAGDHARPNVVLAARHFAVAASAGIPAAQFALGSAYLHGVGVDEDPARALDLLQAAAEQGFLAAAIELGNLYMRGGVVQQDRPTAIDWFCKAGSAGRAFFLGTYEEQIACSDRL